MGSREREWDAQRRPQVEKRGNSHKAKDTHFLLSAFFPELNSAARPLSYLFQFHLVIPKLGNRKNKYVQLSSHIMGISKGQETSCSILVWKERNNIWSLQLKVLYLPGWPTTCKSQASHWTTHSVLLSAIKLGSKRRMILKVWDLFFILT